MVIRSLEILKDVKALKHSALFDRAYYASKYGVPENLAAAHFAKKENWENSPSPEIGRAHV